MVSIKHIANNMAEDLNMEYAVNADALSGVLAPDGSVFGYYVQGAEKGYRSYRLTVTNLEDTVQHLDPTMLFISWPML